MEVIDLLQSSENSRKKNPFSPLSCDVDPGTFNHMTDTLTLYGSHQVSVRLLIYFDQQIMKDVSGVEEEISSSPPVFNVSQALTGSSVDCSWNGSSHHDSVSTAQLYSPQSHHSIGKEVEIVLRIYYD